MTGKLDAIAKRLANYDKVLAKFQKNSNIETMGGRNNHELLMAAHSNVANVDDLRALLAVATAALEVEDVIVYAKASSVGVKKARLQTLLDALKALD